MHRILKMFNIPRIGHIITIFSLESIRSRANPLGDEERTLPWGSELGVSNIVLDPLHH